MKNYFLQTKVNFYIKNCFKKFLTVKISLIVEDFKSWLFFFALYFNVENKVKISIQTTGFLVI